MCFYRIEFCKASVWAWIGHIAPGMAPKKQASDKIRLKKTNSKKAKAALAARKRWERQLTNVVSTFDVSAKTSPENVPSVSCDGQTKPSSATGSTDSNMGPKANKTTFNTRLSDLENFVDLNLNMVENDEKYSIVNLRFVEQLVGKLACPECKQVSLVLETLERVGLAQKLQVHCTNCIGLTIAETYTSDKVENKFDVNRRVVKHFLSTGQGFSALQKFCVVMNMDGMSNSTFSKYSKSLSSSAIKAGQINLEKARARVREVYKELDPSNTVNDDDVLDLSVSFDGTWHKRGHTSNYGVGAVIELHTGLVIDYCVLSKYCHTCSLAKKDLGEDSPEFDIWFTGHKHECNKNHTGSSPAMEVEMAVILWTRSLDYNFRYTTLLSDGDSKAFSRIQELQVYGPEIQIVKEECVNHVSKRLRTALKNVVNDCKKKKITLGGSSYGSLKESTIIKLQRYYKNSILRNKGDVKKMKRDILATLHHCVSTDEVPRHTKCPEGVESWCFYKRAEARKETPGPHKENLKTPITPTVLKYIAPIYERLASYELLNRCLQCLTQNANESLNGVIWSKCPKVRNVSKRAVESAVAEAVGEYNFGGSAIITSLDTSGIKIGNVANKIITSRTKIRMKHAVRRNTNKFKEYRRKLQMIKTYREQKIMEKEGKTYGAGQF